MKSGILYGVGMGPGDPEMITLQAARILREADTVACPFKEPEKSIVYKTAIAAVPEIAQKELVGIHFPMTKDDRVLSPAFDRAAKILIDLLTAGKNVAYLTVGDTMVYSTFRNIMDRVRAAGFEVRAVPGVPSFTAAADRLGVSLADQDEPILILPANQLSEEDLRAALDQPGTKVLMKSGSRLPEIKRMLLDRGAPSYAAENATQENERLCDNLKDLPDDAGYMSTIIVKA